MYSRYNDFSNSQSGIVKQPNYAVQSATSIGVNKLATVSYRFVP